LTRPAGPGRLTPWAAAAGGLAVALAIGARLRLPPPSHTLPGYAAVNGVDPRSAILRLALAFALPLVGGWLARRLVAGGGEPAAPSDRTRSAVTVAAHALVLWTLLLPAVASSGPAVWILFLALAGVSLGLSAVLGGGEPLRGSVYLGAAAPAMAAVVAPSPRGGLWTATVAAAVLLPVLARALEPRAPALRQLLRAATAGILLPGAVVVMAAAAMMQAPRVVDVFEDGHALLPASEYARGERPYRDIVPGHGLVSDGLLNAAGLRVFGDDYAGIQRTERAVGVFFWPAFYALGWAATGSPAFGFGAELFSFLIFPQYMNFRPMLSLWTLAAALYASRTGRRGWWAAVGAALAFGICVAVEFASYAACAAVVALLVARGGRARQARALATGFATAGAIVAIALGAAGVLRGFLHTTFIFVPALLPAYAQGFPAPFAAGIPSWSTALTDDTILLYAYVAVAAVALGACLPAASRLGPRARAALPPLAWSGAAMLSVLERRHVGYALLVVPCGLLLLARWFAGGRPWTSPRPLAAAAALTVLALARARGGLFRDFDAESIAATGEMMRRAGFGPDDTWLDFGNAPGLYYLFGRDCPIRYYEPGFYETDSAQREVVAAIEANPRVRAALVATGFGAIDGVTNAARAPLVAELIGREFRPFYRNGRVEFWIRGKPAPGAEAPNTSAPSRP
jgi:hypothetical protein